MIDGGFGGYVDDGAVLLREHGGEDGAGEGVAGAEIEEEHAVEGFGVEVPEGGAAGVAAYGVDEGVEVAVVVEDLLDEGSGGGFVGDVYDVAGEERCEFSGCGFEGGELFFDAVGYGDLGMVVEEGEGDGASEASGAACDEDYWFFL